eukprot:355265-Chlamydomonas_euryale.AAC.6
MRLLLPADRTIAFQNACVGGRATQVSGGRSQAGKCWMPRPGSSSRWWRFVPSLPWTAFVPAAS